MILAVALGTPHIRHSLLRESGSGLNKASSGRAKLVTNGIRIALAHPIEGVGIGGFKRAYADRVGLKGAEPKKAASHNTAVTVAAETGLPGLALARLADRRGALRHAQARRRARSRAGPAS